MQRLLLFFLCTFFTFAMTEARQQTQLWQKRSYELNDEPIDVVIPCCRKDADLTLEPCIEGIKKYCANVRRIIVVSPSRFTENAEWFDEAGFPFAKDDMIKLVNKKNKKKPTEQKVGWYYQQLLKLYAPLVIPEISSNVLILDADTIFLHDVRFLNTNHGGNYATGTEYVRDYFDHAVKLLPGFKKVFPNHSGICHHMLFQRSIVQDLFALVEKTHGCSFFEAFCKFIPNLHPYQYHASEYELYFNFAFAKTNQVTLRPLKWLNSPYLDDIERYRREGYAYVSCHAWLRKTKGLQ